MKASRKRKYYKSVDHWLDAIYRKNKERINEALEGVKNKKASFKNAVRGYIEEGLSPEKAVQSLENSTLFTTEVERFRKNVLTAIKDYGKYNEFRKMIRGIGGKWAKVSLNQFRYDSEQNLYYYTTELGDIVVIRFENSPQDIILEYLH